MAALRTVLLYSSNMSSISGPPNLEQNVVLSLPKACAGLDLMTANWTWAIKLARIATSLTTVGGVVTRLS